MSVVASPDGLDQNDGTAASPWPLEKGLAALANDEDVLYLRGGTYVGQLFVHKLAGTALKPKVICSYPGEQAIIDGTLEGSVALRRPGQVEAATSVLDQTARASSSNATATRRLAGSSTASS